MNRAYQIIWANSAPSAAIDSAERAVSVAADVYPIQWQDGVRMVKALERQSVGFEAYIRQESGPPAGVIRVVDVDQCWVVACGGAEEPFTMNHVEWLYMWNRATHEHTYYCKHTDVFWSVEDFEQLRSGL